MKKNDSWQQQDIDEPWKTHARKEDPTRIDLAQLAPGIYRAWDRSNDGNSSGNATYRV